MKKDGFLIGSAAKAFDKKAKSRESNIVQNFNPQGTYRITEVANDMAQDFLIPAEKKITF